jgi:ABC-type Fe3+-hydroxamate transport system substrate-binding protein
VASALGRPLWDASRHVHRGSFGIPKELFRSMRPRPVRSRARGRAARRVVAGFAIATAVAAGLVIACAPAKDVHDDVARDDLGDTIPMALVAQRIVSLNPVTTELLLALGEGRRLVGRTHWDAFSDQARAIPDVGDGMMPNVEAVLGQHPDLVVLYATESNRAAATQLRRAGVATLSYRTDHVADLPRVAAVLAAAIGRRGELGAVVDSVFDRLDSLRALAVPTARVRAFWHVWDSPVMTIGKGSYLSELLVIAGGDNVFADLEAPSPQVSLEEIAKRDPDVILAGPSSARAIAQHEGWRAIRAVREGRILIIDTMIVGRPGVRMGEAAQHLRALLYPEEPR